MSDGYGTRSPNQRVWLAAAAALLVVLMAGGGWLVWHGLSRPTPTFDASPATGPSTAAAGSVAFGAPDLVDGVPWGFSPTAEGALGAGVSAVAVTGQAEAVFDPARFAEVAAIVFTDSQAAVQARQVEAARTEFEVSGWAEQPESRRLYFFAPLAVRLVDFQADAGSAQVEVWAMTLVGVGDAGGAIFTTSTVDLTAADETWQVAGLDTVEGPTPLVHHTDASPPGRTRALLRDAVATWPLPLPPPTVGARP